jgi:hypothetical protein
VEDDDLGTLGAALLPGIQYGDGVLARGEGTTVHRLLDVIKQHFQVQFGQLGILQGGVARPTQRYYRYGAGKPEHYVIGLDSTGHE